MPADRIIGLTTSPGRSVNCSTRPSTPARIVVLSRSTCASASAASALAFSAGRSAVIRVVADCFEAVAASSAPYGAAAAIDLETGATQPYQAGRRWSGRAFMDAGGCLYHVGYDPAARKRLWIGLAPGSRRQDVVTGSDEAYRFLGNPIGLDAEGHAFGASLPAFACIAHDGTVAWHQSLDTLDLPGDPQPADSWAVRADGTILIPLQSESRFMVMALGPR